MKRRSVSDDSNSQWWYASQAPSDAPAVEPGTWTRIIHNWLLESRITLHAWNHRWLGGGGRVGPMSRGYDLEIQHLDRLADGQVVEHRWFGRLQGRHQTQLIRVRAGEEEDRHRWFRGCDVPGSDSGIEFPPIRHVGTRTTIRLEWKDHRSGSDRRRPSHPPIAIPLDLDAGHGERAAADHQIVVEANHSDGYGVPAIGCIGVSGSSSDS